MNVTQPVEKNYGLTLDRREKAVLTGVTDVERFDESEVVLSTHGGRLILTGTNLHVASLQLEEGRLLVDGTIDGVMYDGAGPKRRAGRNPAGGFLRRALG